jgi:hypothetical protein
MVVPKYLVYEGSMATFRSSSCAKNRFIKSFRFVFIHGRNSFGLGSSRFRLITSCKKFCSLGAPPRFGGFLPNYQGFPGRRHRFTRDMSDPREHTKVYSHYRSRCRTLQYRIVLICGKEARTLVRRTPQNQDTVQRGPATV